MLRMVSSFNIHVFTFEKFGNARREEAKTDSNAETTQTLVGFRRKASTPAVENLEQVPVTRTSLPLKTTVMTTTRSNQQMLIKHTNDPVDPGSDVGAEALDFDDDEENDTFSPNVALDDVSVFEAVELDATTLLADTWDNDLDLEVSA